MRKRLWRLRPDYTTNTSSSHHMEPQLKRRRATRTIQPLSVLCLEGLVKGMLSNAHVEIEGIPIRVAEQLYEALNSECRGAVSTQKAWPFVRDVWATSVDSLCLRQASTTTDVYACLAAVSSLRTLCLRDIANLDSTSLQPLASLYLVRIDVSFCTDIGDAAAAALAACTSLEDP